MKSLLFVRNSVIIVLCITILLLSAGFIVLSIELKEKNDQVHTFDVSFIDVRKSSSVKGSTVEPTSSYEISKSGKELNLNYTMNSVHDEITYVALIRNNGNMKAQIVDVVESPNYQEELFSKMIFPVTITTSNINDRILAPGEELEIKIIAYYSPFQGEIKKMSFPYKLSLVTKST